MISRILRKLGLKKSVEPTSYFGIGHDVLPGLSKIQEEMSELGVVFAKLIQTKGGWQYWGEFDLKRAMLEEIADLEAALEYFNIYNLSAEDNNFIYIRKWQKFDGYVEWHKGRDNDPTKGKDDR